uniref:Uncharacterized protein n=1 Tax=Opuntia streptacantha TaxID=393608 RepID=A0A7C9DNQ5_OPUST
MLERFRDGFLSCLVMKSLFWVWEGLVILILVHSCRYVRNDATHHSPILASLLITRTTYGFLSCLVMKSLFWVWEGLVILILVHSCRYVRNDATHHSPILASLLITRTTYGPSR